MNTIPSQPVISCNSLRAKEDGVYLKRQIARSEKGGLGVLMKTESVFLKYHSTF